ncbi:hypothetical protein BHF71_08740 [Vulcanibacillus modesticaldus]|uniref:Flagellar biosynthesis protein FlaG n=2 Tax=Vulcanibacillus modesticaldus TaxID=337097 RepID=A0A1D2YUZ3_9BACI|nr:hypothetical protein BHF71_08740 [Vulcanibacillus modesticaldus]
MAVDRTQDKIDIPIKSNQTSTNEEMEQRQAQQISKEKLEKTIEGMNQFIKPSQTSLKFQLHEKLNEYFVQIVDSKTNEVIKEIPSKKFLDMYATMMEAIGLLVDQRI